MNPLIWGISLAISNPITKRTGRGVGGLFPGRHFIPFLILTAVCACGFKLPAQSNTPATGADTQKQIFTTVDGLPANRLTALHQDRSGFLWIGTVSGLVCYDGYRFQAFETAADDSSGINDKMINHILEDKEGNLWVTVRSRGINRLDPATGTVTGYRHNPKDSNSLGSNIVVHTFEFSSDSGAIWASTAPPGRSLERLEVATGKFTHFFEGSFAFGMYEDRQGTAWLGANGLYRFNISAGTRNQYLPAPEYADDSPKNWILSIYEDHEGILWIAGSSWICQFDRETELFSSRMDLREIVEIEDAFLFRHSIIEDPAGILWIGGRHGLFRYERESDRFLSYDYSYSPNQGESAINDMIFDRSGVLWAATGYGLIKLNRRYPFSIWQHVSGNPKSLISNRIRAIWEDDAGALWVGHDNSRIDRLDSQTGDFKRYDTKTGTENRGSLSDIYEDSAGKLWAAECPAGLKRFNEESGEFELVGLEGRCVNPMLEDSAGNFWIGTYDAGLFLLDRDSGTFTNIRHDPDNENSLASNLLIPLYQDRQGTIWIGHHLGLSRMNLDPAVKIEIEDAEKTLSEITFLNYQESGLQMVMHILEDRQDRFWIATEDGLRRFDREKGVTTAVYTTEDGLCHNSIRAIIEDEDGYLWLSTDKGLSRFDPDTEDFVNFDINDGLPGNIFREHAHFQNPQTGEIFLGGFDGLISFFPKEITSDPITPAVVITDLHASGERLTPGPERPLQKTIAFTDSITLTHEQNNLLLKYVGLHFVNPANNVYQYMLENYDKEWIDAGTQRSVRYPQLQPGEYIFRVKAANSTGLWNEEGDSLNITILPPWWRTYWAYAGYILFVLCGLFAVDRFQRRRLIRKERDRTRERELADARKLERAHNELESAYNELKSTQAKLVHQEKMASLGELTAGIAHEIKNPLNFVNNFAELSRELVHELLDAFRNNDKKKSLDDGEINDILTDLERNAAKIAEHGKRADRIVEGMLQHSRGRSGERKLTDINLLIEECLNLSYHGMRARHTDFNIEIEKELDPTIDNVNIIPQDINRVLLNLMTNGFYEADKKRRTLQDGFQPKLFVKSAKLKNKIEIRIRDNGNGIPKDIQKKLFNPFFTTKPTGEGTGLGLSISYDIIVQEHHGDLRFETEEGEFAEFVITLPG